MVTNNYKLIFWVNKEKLKYYLIFYYIINNIEFL